MGFDNECIINIQSLAGEYFCPVCRTLVYPNEALQSQCTHLYCKPCLTYIVSTTRACPYDGYLVTEADSKPLVESNKALADTIGKIVVHCLYHRSGCAWQGSLSECTSHCSGCAFGNSPVVCNRCGIQIVHRQVQEHAQNCPGVNTQPQQPADGAQDAAISGAAADQNQTATQSGTPTSQGQASQTTTAPLPGQDQNQPANSSTQVQAVAPAAVPTADQWYQQQYQQYYQQYPGYDAYQQSYQQYYPYQQQVIQQVQQNPPHVQGQQQPQVYAQPTAPTHVQLQVQPQPQTQPQVQAPPQTQSQPQPQIPLHGQPQPHAQVPDQVAQQHQLQAQVNPQQQLHPTVQSHPQIQSQARPLSHMPPQPLPYPQAQPHPQPYLQQNMQLPQYQQPHSQMHQPQPQVQSQPHSQVQPPSHPQTQPQSQPHVQAHLQPHPQLHPYPNQPPIPSGQPQTQHPTTHAVTGHNFYPQSQVHQQMQLGPPKLHPMNVQPLAGPSPPSQLQSQFPQQTPQMRPLHHAPMPNQPTASHGQAPVIPPAQPQQILPYAQQLGHTVHQHPVMQPVQQPVPQPPGQQQQSFSGPLPPSQSQLHHGYFAQHQPMLAQIRPQGSQLMQQNSPAYLQAQQNAAPLHSIQLQQSQHYAGRPVMPSPGVPAQPFPQSSGAFGAAAQVRPVQLGLNQPSVHQNYANKTNNQLQPSSEQQSGLTEKPALLERSGDHISQKDVTEQVHRPPSQKAAEKGTNSIGDDSIEVKAMKLESDMCDEQKPAAKGLHSLKSEPCVKDTEFEVLAAKDGSDSAVIKQVMKEEGGESTLEPSLVVKSVNISSGEEKDVIKAAPGEMGHYSVGGPALGQAESLDAQKVNLLKDPIDVSLQASVGTDKGSAAIAPPSASKPNVSVENAFPQGNTQAPLIGRDGLQNNEFGGFQGKGFPHSSLPVPPADQGSHQLPPVHYGLSAHQQRPAAPSMLPSAPPQGAASHAQGLVPPATLLRPGQPFNAPEHFQAPLLRQFHGSFRHDVPFSGPPGPALAVTFERGPGQIGPNRSFDTQSGAVQGYHNQDHVSSSHAGLSRASQGPPLGVVPPGPTNPQGGIMGRVPPPGPEGQLGLQRPIKPVETEIFSNQGPHRFDVRQLDSHLPGTFEGGPLGQPAGIDSNMMRMNGPPGLDSSTLGLRDERSKDLTNDRSNNFSMEPTRRVDKGEFKEDLKPFPRSSHLDNDHIPKLGSYLSSSRPNDRGPHGFMDMAFRHYDKAPNGFNYDAGTKFDPAGGGASSRLFPPYPPGGTMHPNDSGERALPISFHDDSRGRADFSGPLPGFGRHHMEHSTSRSTGREYIGISSRGFGGLSGGPHGLDDFDGRERPSFGEVSTVYNLPSDPLGNSFHENKFPTLPGHLRRGELDGPGNFLLGERSNEFIGQDIPPDHLQRGEPLGPRNLPGHLRLGEPIGFGAFPGQAHMGEYAGPGNFAHHPRLGEPGFRSSYSFRGFPNDGGFFAGDMDAFDKSRKRKSTSMGWCRICKVDCETVEGLDLHSQTREHQRMAMDMVKSIKQQNLKKQKKSKDRSAHDAPTKSKIASSEGRGNKP